MAKHTTELVKIFKLSESEAANLIDKALLFTDEDTAYIDAVNMWIVGG